jgi:FG-GAP-like repeat/RTX calcium-binding nonapeptide repeat (4 copies)
MGVATGAYAAATDTVYLQESFVATGDISDISAVIVEELGHAIDSRVNTQETPGDEGAIFRLLVGGIKIAQHLLAELRREDDWGTITVDGQQLVVEMAVINGTAGADYLIGTLESDQINGLEGDDVILAYSLNASQNNGGIDTLNGGAGNDTIFAALGNTIDGGAGRDSLTIVNDTPRAVAANLTFDANGNATGTDGTSIKNIENFTFIGNFRDDYVNAGAFSSDNVFDTGGGKDTLIGGSGNDFYTIQNDQNNPNGVNVIDDRGGRDELRIGGNVNNIVFRKSGTTLGVDSNGDQRDDLLILNFFGANGGAGTGAIETISQRRGDGIINPRSLASILNQFSPVNNDIGGDRRSDILWRRGDGGVTLWQMDGNNIASKSSLSTPIDTNFKIVGTGDFNGDGTADILWSDTKGAVALWQMNGGTIASSALVTAGADTGWSVSTTGDFNGDSKTDIFWRNANGDVAIMQMDGQKIVSSAVLGKVDSKWTSARAGDFNGDGKSDILWRSDFGELALWLMDGNTVTYASELTGFNSYLEPTRQLVGINDFNGDGRSDLMWQDNKGLIFWGQFFTTEGSLGLTQSSLGGSAGFKVVGTGDYNADSKADILLRDATGANAIWTLDGSNILSQQFIDSTDPNWSVTPAGASSPLLT